jgi:hypothetical protein
MWLKTCNESHTECTWESTFQPTRLIDVGPPGGSQDLRIVISDPSSKTPPSGARYLALSYCWGNSMPEHTKTTSRNIRARMRGFPASILPKTIMDAIEVTRNLRLRYIWIDTLCILQDSKIDWETESATMNQVYSHAYCTLAASSATDTEAGFPFQQHRPGLRENKMILHYDSCLASSPQRICIGLA